MFETKRPAPADRCFTSPAIEQCIEKTVSKIRDPEIAWLFSNCFPNTLDTTITHAKRGGKPDTIIITGDIPAMWLRDSTAQVWPYLPLAKHDPKLRQLLAGVVRRQAACVLIDPYANAFCRTIKQRTEWKKDNTEMKPGVFERKYELDSLCAVLRLSTGYHDATGDTGCFDAQWEQAIDTILETIRREQEMPAEGEKPHYSFMRTTPLAHDTLSLGGKGHPGRTCGLSRSPFRPSDDSTILPFLIPSNAMAVACLKGVARLCDILPGNEARAQSARALAETIDAAIRQTGIISHPVLGKVFAYEVDGFGSYYFMDDANVPSLLSLPYLGYCAADDPVYLNTRKGVLGHHNPYYSEGKAGAGIGGPHVGGGFIWPISIMMRAMTSDNETEITDCLSMLKQTHAGTGFMHETFWKDDAARFTRSWFAWANSLFGELILHLENKYPGLLSRV